MVQPLISLVIPAYNVASYLSDSIDSAIHQDYANLEIIVINDGSTDRTADIIDHYAARDSRIRPIHQGNAGIMAVRHRAIEMATGDYLCFLDGDDLLTPKAISTLYEAMQCSSADIVCGDEIRVGKDYRQRWSECWEGIIDGATFLRYQLTNRMEGFLHAKLYKRVLFEGLEYPPEISLAEDKYINIQIATRKPTVLHIPFVAYQYVKRQESVSHRIPPIEYGIGYTQHVEEYLRRAGCYEQYEAEVELMRIRFYLMHIGHTSNPSIAHLPFTHHIYAQLKRPEVERLVRNELRQGEVAIIQLYRRRGTVWMGKVLTTVLRIRQSLLKRMKGISRKGEKYAA